MFDILTICKKGIFLFFLIPFSFHTPANNSAIPFNSFLAKHSIYGLLHQAKIHIAIQCQWHVFIHFTTTFCPFHSITSFFYQLNYFSYTTLLLLLPHKCSACTSCTSFSHSHSSTQLGHSVETKQPKLCRQ